MSSLLIYFLAEVEIKKYSRWANFKQIRFLSMSKNHALKCIFFNTARRVNSVDILGSLSTFLRFNFLGVGQLCLPMAFCHVMSYDTHHGLRTPNESINQRYLKNWADVADKICCRHT